MQQNWLTIEDLENLLKSSKVKVIKVDRAILLPDADISVISKLATKVLVKNWPFSPFALSNFIIPHPVSSIEKVKRKFTFCVCSYSCSLQGRKY